MAIPSVEDLFNIKWTKYIPNRPTPKQLAFLMLNKEVALFGGALGGGKSDVLLMAALQYVDTPGYAAMIFRKSLTDLKQPGALIDRSMKWLAPYLASREVKWSASEHTFYFPTQWPDGSPGHDAKLCFGYIGDAEIRERYQSSEFQYIAFDELTTWVDSKDFEFMFSRIRQSGCPIHKADDKGKPLWDDRCMYCRTLRAVPKRMRAATNPGGSGGTWVKNWFRIKPDPEKYPSRKDALIALQKGEVVRFVGTDPNRVFIPSFLEDNPFLDRESYDKMLDNMSEQDQDRLRNGNWEFRPDSRFKRINARYYTQYDGAYHLPHEIVRRKDLRTLFATVDTAASVKEGPVDDQVKRGAPSWTVISTWGITKDYRLIWLDMKRFRKEIPDVVENIISQYIKWRHDYVKIEYVGTGIGPAQYAEINGVPVVRMSKNRDKITNATAALMLMKAGRVYFPENAPWLEIAEDEVFGWTGLPTEEDDIIDTLSDAANEVSLTGLTEATPISLNVNRSSRQTVKHVKIHLPYS